VTDVSDAVVGQPCQFRGMFKSNLIFFYVWSLNIGIVYS
jgi:hypothetical protein